MSISKRLSEQEIKTSFTHYGWFAWVVPVYANDTEVVERNWVPEWWFDGIAGLCDFFEITPSLYLTDDIKWH